MLISSSGDSNFNKSKIYSECRISITNIILNTNYWNSVGIKQWRFELRTPLPKRGAQPLGHLPDKFEKQVNNMVQLSLINTLEMFNIHSHPRLEIVFFLFENIRRSVSHLICFQYLSFRIVATLLCHISTTIDTPWNSL